MSRHMANIISLLAGIGAILYFALAAHFPLVWSIMGGMVGFVLIRGLLALIELLTSKVRTRLDTPPSRRRVGVEITMTVVGAGCAFAISYATGKPLWFLLGLAALVIGIPVWIAYYRRFNGS